MVVDYIRALVSRARVSPRQALVAAACVILAVACATTSRKPPVGTPEPDRFLWERGTENLNKRRWLTSREYFRQLVDSYPQSIYRADAKLGVGDTYLGEGTSESKVLAINEYREFLSFYPRHDRAHYAQFKLGMAHYYQMHGSDRDQTETIDAIAELTTFVQRYPDSPLITEGRQRLREAKDRYSDAGFNVGVFYLRTQKYPPAAVDRFKEVLKTDPEYTRRDGVYFYLAQALIKLNQSAEALPWLDRLISEFEQSEYLEEAQKLVVTLKSEMSKKTGGVSYVP
jgi:outer membrane protein assembly factor BamD